MTRDREVNLGDLDGVTVDTPGTTPSLSASPGGRDKKTPPGRKKTAPKPQKPTPSGGGNGGWMAACLVLMVLIAVLGVWFSKQVAGLQAQLDSRLTESSEKMGNLQSRLSATDETLNQSSGKLLETVQSYGKKLAANENEIRKLWDVSNTLNKTTIAKQQKALNALSLSVKEVKKGQAGVDGKLKSISVDAAALKKQMESAVAAVNKSSDQWQSQIGQMQTRMEVLVDSIKQLEREQINLKNGLAKVEKDQGKISALDASVDDLEAAIAAFDAYRLQVNSRLDSLEGR
jgi:chromosome segregation ATPase